MSKRIKALSNDEVTFEGEGETVEDAVLAARARHLEHWDRIDRVPDPDSKQEYDLFLQVRASPGGAIMYRAILRY